MRFIPLLFFATGSIFLILAGEASAHWEMDSRFWQDKSDDEKFHFRLHNGIHANRKPVSRELKVCFWLERNAGDEFEPISDRKCSLTTLEPDEWGDFEFNVYDLDIFEHAKTLGQLKQGVYRAKVSAREQKNRISSLLFGAALERLVIDLVYRDGHFRPPKKTSW